jgi:uncharacterized membrane protein
MMEGVTVTVGQLFEVVGLGFDVFGVLIILIGVVAATLRYLRGYLRRVADDGYAPYRRYKVEIGLALLLGLEILVAADIIKTVALEPNFTSLGVLAVLVIVRTFLSWALVLEIEGRWPWQARSPNEA